MSASCLILIPSYNTGRKLVETVREARRVHEPVWVVVDGSTDGSADTLHALAREDTGLRIFTLERNRGKGAAILHGLREAVAAGYTHVLTLDSDGQHPASLIPEFIAQARANPDALILGKPVFDHTAPFERVIGRKLSNWLADLETLNAGIGDSLFGMRVYPARPLLEVMEAASSMRRFDFDAESAVRLVWQGMRPLNVPAPVRYFRADEGGVSHYRYIRDNLLLASMHTRLFLGFLIRLPILIMRRARKQGMPGERVKSER